MIEKKSNIANIADVVLSVDHGVATATLGSEVLNHAEFQKPAPYALCINGVRTSDRFSNQEEVYTKIERIGKEFPLWEVWAVYVG